MNLKQKFIDIMHMGESLHDYTTINTSLKTKESFLSQYQSLFKNPDILDFFLDQEDCFHAMSNYLLHEDPFIAHTLQLSYARIYSEMYRSCKKREHLVCQKFYELSNKYLAHVPDYYLKEPHQVIHNYLFDEETSDLELIYDEYINEEYKEECLCIPQREATFYKIAIFSLFLIHQMGEERGNSLEDIIQKVKNNIERFKKDSYSFDVITLLNYIFVTDLVKSNSVTPTKEINSLLLKSHRDLHESRFDIETVDIYMANHEIYLSKIYNDFFRHYENEEVLLCS